MKVNPIAFRDAVAFVNAHHRHNKAPVGHKFSIGCFNEEELVGVAICGRPVARRLDNGKCLEVTRVCTNGFFNACSKLYASCCRIARRLGYERVITYTLVTENAASVRAANFELDAANVGGIAWTGKRRYKGIPSLKNRWVKFLKRS